MLICIHSTIASNSISTTAIITVISTAFAIMINYFIFKKNYNAAEIKRLDDNLNQMINYTIQYPYLEEKTFIESWVKNKSNPNEQYMRYESYCIFVFNFLDRLCRYYNFNKISIEKFIHIKEVVRIHAEWWKNPTGEYDNIEGYSDDFRKFINSYLN